VAILRVKLFLSVYKGSMDVGRYVVCIPSYNRAEICNKKTLALLKRLDVERSRIRVYVANASQHALYSKALDPAYYGHLVVGRKGLARQREFIGSQFPHGKRILFLDDDISDIDLGLSQFRNMAFTAFVDAAFAECQASDAFIWGVYPVNNRYFMTHRPERSTHLTYIVGAMYGVINRPNLKDIKIGVKDEKEDVYRTIKYFLHDGTVLRFNRIGFATQYYGRVGGMGTREERLEASRLAVANLAKKHPDMGVVHVRKNGVSEFKLKRLPSKNNKKSTFL
jgi:cellulose synthase/poly-beta-1,6-N-acetylglucosamine synthase-like glycosyltransferase